MQNTEHLNLPTYELDDMANLVDGYNEAMETIDTYAQANDAKFPITSANIEDGTIEAVDIANGAVSTNKIATAAVTADKIATAAVTADKLATDAVTNENMINGAVTIDKINENTFDAMPAKNSSNLVNSGGIYQFVNSISNLDKKLLIFGDSWANPKTSYYHDWGETLAGFLHCDLTNYGNGGATFTTNSTDPEVSILAQANNAIAAETDPTSVKYIAIVGGVNDLASTSFSPSTYTNAVKNVYDALTTAFPNAKITHLQNCCLYNSDVSANQYRVLNLYKNIATLNANLNNCFSTALCTLLLANTNFFNSDLLHLSQAGINVLIQQFLHEFGFRGSVITSGSANSSYDYSAKITANEHSLTLDFQKYADQTQASFTGTMDPATETAVKAILNHCKKTVCLGTISSNASTGDISFIYNADELIPTTGVFHKPSGGSQLTTILTYTL